jgi:hypothetical protein
MSSVGVPGTAVPSGFALDLDEDELCLTVIDHVVLDSGVTGIRPAGYQLVVL